MANFLKPEMIEHIEQLAHDGFGVNAISRALGISSKTVPRYFPYDLGMLCACGQPVGHKGWCAVRYAQSVARQRVLGGKPAFTDDSVFLARILNQFRDSPDNTCLRCETAHDGSFYRCNPESRKIFASMEFPTENGKSRLCQRCQHEAVRYGGIVGLLANDFAQIIRSHRPSRFDTLWRQTMKKPAPRTAAKAVPPPITPDPAPVARTFHGLRDVLFDEINALRGPNPDPRRAMAVSSLAKQITNTVTAELNVAKETLAIRDKGGDVQVGTLALGGQVNAASAGVLVKAH